MSGTASIWGGSTVINSTANADNSYLTQVFGTPTAGQTVFPLTVFAYAVGTASLDVFVNGVRQNLGSDFTETSPSSFTFTTTEIETIDIVVAVGKVGLTGATDAAASAAASAASAAAALASYNAILALSLPSLPLTIANGGTGSNTAVNARTALSVPTINVSGLDQLNAKGADIASAATINLDTSTGDMVDITGSITITKFTLGAGKRRTLRFTGAPQVNNNANIINPTGANLTMAAGNIMTLRAIAVDTVIIESITKSDGTAISSALKLLASTSFAAANIQNFLTTFSSLYDNYMLVCNGILFATTDQVIFQFAVAGVLDVAGNYVASTAGASSSTLVSSIILTGNIFGGGKGGSFTALIKNVNDAVNLKHVHADNGSQQNGTPSYAFSTADGLYIATNVVTGFGLKSLGGNVFSAGGTIQLFGFNKA